MDVSDDESFNKFSPPARGKLIKKIAGFCWNMFGVAFGMTGTGIGIYDYCTTPSNKQLKDELLDVQKQLNEIQGSVSELINAVKEESIRTQYNTAGRAIVESLRCHNNYLNMTYEQAGGVLYPRDEQGAAYWRKEFLKWGGSVRESVSFLLDGILGHGLIGSDILQAIADIVNKNVCV